jgi:hypothetical protein
MLLFALCSQTLFISLLGCSWYHVTFTLTGFLGLLFPLIFWNEEHRPETRMCCWCPEVRLPAQLSPLANISHSQLSSSAWGTKFHAHTEPSIIWIAFFILIFTSLHKMLFFLLPELSLGIIYKAGWIISSSVSKTISRKSTIIEYHFVTIVFFHILYITTNCTNMFCNSVRTPFRCTWS